MIRYVDALIPICGAMLILVCPQWFTRKDLKAEENRALSARLKKIGWLLLAAGTLILIATIGSSMTRK